MDDVLRVKLQLVRYDALRLVDMINSAYYYEEGPFLYLIDSIIKAVTDLYRYSAINLNYKEDLGDIVEIIIRKKNKNDNCPRADIFIDKRSKHQRFAAVHALGRLALIENNENIKFKKLTCMYCSADIESPLSKKFDDMSDEEWKELAASVFALFVLMPHDIKQSDISRVGVDRLISKYGVPEEAIYSRMLISNL